MAWEGETVESLRTPSFSCRILRSYPKTAGNFYEWDNNKAQINIKKHGITFDEASTVFAGEYAILFDDSEYSIEEERFMLLE